jgi:hypothetical protein|tara:strand:+ start:207 stop:371 length:165 start_codon:yes stop_codon:yes gene_type:complete
MPDNTSQKLVEEFKATLDDKHLVAMKIAEEQLESSFDITKSIGFKEWCAKREKN